MVRHQAPSEVRFPARHRKPLSANLSGLTIGSLSLTPGFDPWVTDYSVTTSNATNKVTATAESADSTIQIMNGEAEVENGSSASWSDGENALTITVRNGDQTKVYTVTVTKS